MLSAIEQFRENIVRVNSLGGLTQAISKMTTAVIDTSDILRAQYVLAVSALDHYCHEAARLGMLEVFDRQRPASPAYLRFRISLDCLGADLIVSRSSFDAEIRTQLGFISFQSPDKVAEAVRLVKDIKIWEAVGSRLGVAHGTIKDQLKLIIDRRNKIAHEADIDPTYPKARWPIVASDVEDVVTFLVDVVEAIHSEIE